MRFFRLRIFLVKQLLLVPAGTPRNDFDFFPQVIAEISIPPVLRRCQRHHRSCIKFLSVSTAPRKLREVFFGVNGTTEAARSFCRCQRHHGSCEKFSLVSTEPQKLQEVFVGVNGTTEAVRSFRRCQRNHGKAAKSLSVGGRFPLFHGFLL
jgi:hypothetical protein